MRHGSKSKYSAKQKRQANHIDNSEEYDGKSSSTSARIAWATVNKEALGPTKLSHKLTHH